MTNKELIENLDNLDLVDLHFFNIDTKHYRDYFIKKVSEKEKKLYYN